MKKIKFLGMFEKQQQKGCTSCRGSKKSSKFIYKKTFETPSGIKKEFVKDKIYEVTNADAEFFLNIHEYFDMPNIFEEVT